LKFIDRARIKFNYCLQLKKEVELHNFVREAKSQASKQVEEHKIKG